MIQKKGKENFDNIDWLNYLAAINNHNVFESWKYNNDLFFDRYFILNNEEILIILDKKNYTTYEFPKNVQAFGIEFKKEEVVEIEEPKEKTLFSFGNIKVKKEVV